MAANPLVYINAVNALASGVKATNDLLVFLLATCFDVEEMRRKKPWKETSFITLFHSTVEILEKQPFVERWSLEK